MIELPRLIAHMILIYIDENITHTSDDGFHFQTLLDLIAVARHVIMIGDSPENDYQRCCLPRHSGVFCASSRRRTEQLRCGEGSVRFSRERNTR